ncbi:MAG TPA: glutamate racemase [Candidatus Pelethomonas intestinigallinarum]|nr:glutamate racemase [Candidatus Pelethomonas intestinigallinarum]
MDPRPIGVFDSGFGGLTAVRQLRRIMPSETIIYFGDTARVPYGNRSRDTLLRYARQDVAFLRSFDPKAIVIACGTVSSNCLEELQAENKVPILGVVEPTVRRAIAATRSGRVGLAATRASVSSGAYERLFHRLAPAVEVVSRACPLFVPLVEEGRCRPGDVVIETVAEEYLGPLRGEIDTLVLGCTHYPLLREVIGRVMGPEVELVDAGAEAARAVRDLLEERDALSGGEDQGQARYYTSDQTEQFLRLAPLFLGEDVTGRAEQIDITRY